MKVLHVVFLAAIALAAAFLMVGAVNTARSATATATLSAGWNHVCYIGAEAPVETALSDITGSIQAVYRIGAGGTPERWFPGRPQSSTIETLAPYEPLLLLTPQTLTWTQTSDELAPATADLGQGWNAVCYEGEDKDIEEAVEGIDGQIAIIYAFVPGQGWLRYVPDRPDVSRLDGLQRHQPILVLVSEPAGATWRFEDGEVELPPLAPFDAALETKAHGVRDQMAQARGLEPHPTIQEGTISRDALGQYYEQLAATILEETGDDAESWNVAYRLLHLIGPTDDLLEIWTGFSTEATLGFYAPAEDKLALVAEELTDFDLNDELTLAHEYVHSFQDARFDLEELSELADEEEEARANTEYGTTVECLVEGDAVVSEIMYAEAAFGPDWYDQVPATNGDAADSEYPPGIERYEYFPYVECAGFIIQLFAQGGWDAINAAYEDVPVSTEQILHPEKYASHEPPTELEMPDLSGSLGAGWGQLDDSVFGEFDVYNYLLTSLEGQTGWDSIAGGAAAGWGGGRLAVYSHDDPTRVVLHLTIQWDEPGDLDEFVAAFLHVAGTTAGLWWPADPSISSVHWSAEAEHGFATWQGTSFVALLAANADDLRLATAAAGYDLDAAVNPSLSAPPATPTASLACGSSDDALSEIEAVLGYCLDDLAASLELTRDELASLVLLYAYGGGA
jgi:hypothetical protein